MNPSFKKKNVVVFGVSKDSIDSHNKFADKYQLPYVLLSDPRTEVMKKYGAFGKKMMYGKEVQGTIRSTVVIGPKGDVIKHWTIVKKAEEHPKDSVGLFRGRRLIDPKTNGLASAYLRSTFPGSSSDTILALRSENPQR